MINRILAEKLRGTARQFPVVALLGPRQSGKTTLVKHVFANWAYVSLEDLDVRGFAQNDPRGFLQTYSSRVILDEIQRAPELFSYLQTVVDREGRSGQFVLTGSHNFLLHEKISQSLAGRVYLLKLLPLSLEELKTAGYPLENFEEFLFKGFYPRIYDAAITPQDWYPSYVQTYVERDVRLLKNIADLNVFQKFLRMCAARIGQLLNLSSLANDCGITHNTAKAWLAVLEASFVIFLLQPHHKNFNKRLVKSPKLYFYDTGLACSLLSLENQNQLASHYLKGGLFESFVLAELLKHRYNHGLTPNLYFWRDKVGNEIDGLIEAADRLIPIEIKAGRTIAEDFFAGLAYYSNLSNLPLKKACLIYGGNERQTRSTGRVIPWQDVTDCYKN